MGGGGPGDGERDRDYIVPAMFDEDLFKLVGRRGGLRTGRAGWGAWGWEEGHGMGGLGDMRARQGTKQSLLCLMRICLSL